MEDAIFTDEAEEPRGRTVRELRELVAALDRRVPHVERAGEAGIAYAAAALRAAAVRRIEELEQAEAQIAGINPAPQGRASDAP
jgi:hypothetical protein